MKPGTIIRLSRGYYRGFFRVLADHGRILELRELTRLGDGPVALGACCTVRAASQRISRPRRSTLLRRGLIRA